MRSVSFSPSETTAKPETLAGKNVLVVGINYFPEPTGIAPYTTGLVDHISRRAAATQLLTGVTHYPSWRVTPEQRWMIRSSDSGPTVHDSLKVTRLRHYVPARQSAARRATYEATFLLNALCTRRAPTPDLVVAVTPSLGGAVAGAVLARRHGVPLLVVVQDLMAKAASQSGISSGQSVAGATAAIEGWALRHASRVAVVSEAFRAPVTAYGVDPDLISVLPNWTHVAPSQESRSTTRDVLGWAPKPWTVVHTGNIGLKQDLGNIVETARAMSAHTDVSFVIVGDGSQRQAVQQQAAGLTNISFVDPLDDGNYARALVAADVLVVNERSSVGDMSLPSKLTSYLVAGRPVLAAVSPDGATARELARTDGAALLIAPGDPAAMADAVIRLRDDADASGRMGEAGRRYAFAKLGRGASMDRLDDILAECLAA